MDQPNTWQWKIQAAKSTVILSNRLAKCRHPHHPGLWKICRAWVKFGTEHTVYCLKLNGLSQFGRDLDIFQCLIFTRKNFEKLNENKQKIIPHFLNYQKQSDVVLFGINLNYLFPTIWNKHYFCCKEYVKKMFLLFSKHHFYIYKCIYTFFFKFIFLVSFVFYCLSAYVYTFVCFLFWSKFCRPK